MSYFKENIMYLENPDMDAQGKLNVPGKAVIMLQSTACGHCVKAKPEYQKFADWAESQPGVAVLTVQFDSSEKSDVELANRLKKLIPGFRGLPTFVLYDDGDYVKTHTGARTSAALQDLVGEEMDVSDSESEPDEVDPNLPMRARRN